MQSDRNYWISRWGDHLIRAFHQESDAILARNAEAIELGDTDLPEEILELFRIDVERTKENPEGMIRLVQASYSATFQTIGEMVLRIQQR